jgi:HAD superfamily hydrolase (TIGR01549 family)
MIKTILFDLDNTLILFDETKFFKAYLNKVAPIMSDLASPHTLWHMILNATKAVLHNNGKLTNKEVFFQTFIKDLGGRCQTQEIWNRFQQFYENEFDHLRSHVTINKGVSEIFSVLAQKNIKIVIASNPFWPLIAMEKRMAWAGLDKKLVHLITHLENMHFCKPRLEYYQEICTKIKENPEDCLMVGDDPVNDMVAGKLGIKTFLITDSKKFKTQLRTISNKIRFGWQKGLVKPDYTGSLIQFQKILLEL